MKQTNSHISTPFTMAFLLALALIAYASPVQAAISFVKTVGTASNKSTSTSIQVTVGASGVASGNTLIVSFAGDFSGGDEAVIPTCSDSQGNTYNTDVDQYYSGQGIRTAICSAYVDTALTNGDTITVTHASMTPKAMSVNEFSGLLSFAALDQKQSAVNSDSTPSSGSTATTTQADELIFGAIGMKGPSGDTFTKGGTFTAVIGRVGTTGASAASNRTINPEYKIVSSTGTYLADGSNSSSRPWAAAVATYRDASGPPFTLVGDATSPSDKSVFPSAVNQAVSAFTLSTNTGTDTLTALTVTFTGTNASDVAGSGVKIYKDVNGDREWDAGDSLISNGTASFSGTTASFSSLNESVSTTPTNYIVTYDLVASPGVGNTLQGAVTAATVTTNNPPTISDTNDATLTVASTCSVTANDAASLRACITWANGNPGTDTIIVPAGIYNLTGAGTGEDANVDGDLDITESVIVDGDGMTSTIIDASGISGERAIHITAGDVTFTDLTIRNADAGSSTGAGIYDQGATSVTLTRVSVTGNSTSGHGGGIYTSGGTLTFTDVELDNNHSTANTSGGIYAQGTGTVTWTGGTISNNTSAGNHSAIRNGGTFNATNVTISGNTTTSSTAVFNSGTATFTNCTIYNNSGGTIITIGGGSSTTFKNTIVSNPGYQNCQQAFTSSGGNLETDGNTCGFTTGTDQNTVSQANLNIDATLKDNGGYTKTHALLVGSYAIDAGITSGAPATDQLGTARGFDGDATPNSPQSGDYDIGAFEYSGGASTISVSGSCQQQDEATNCADGRTIRVAVNNSLQGQTTTTTAGAWTISGVTQPSSGDVITVYIQSVDDANEAVAVTKYDGDGDITGIELMEEHLSIGSNDNQTLTNADLSQYDYSASINNEDIFIEVDGANDLTVDNLGNMANEEIYVRAGTTYRPDSASSGNVTTKHMEIAGTLIADGNTFAVSGDWDSSGGTFAYDTSTVNLTGTGNLKTPGTNYTVYFNNLSLAAATKTTTLQSHVGAANAISLGTGTVEGSSYELGTFANSGTPVTDAGATKNLSAFYYRPSNGTVNVTGGTYNSNFWLWPTGSNATLNLADALTASGVLGVYGDTGNSGIVVNTQNNDLTTYQLHFGDPGYDGSTTMNLGSSTIDIDDRLRVGVNGGSHFLNLGSASIFLGRSWLNQNGTGTLTVNPGTSTVTFDGVIQQNILSNGQSFNNLIINKTEPDGTTVDDLVLSDALDINGTFTITDGELKLDTNNADINTAGNVGIAAAGLVSKGTGTWTFDGASQILSDASAGQNLGTVSIGPSTTTSVSTSSNATLESLTIGADDTLDISDDTLTLTGTGTPLSIAGGGSLTTTGSTVIYSGSGSPTNITTTGYNHLQLSPGAATTFSLTGDLTGGNAMTGNLTVGVNATLDATAANNYDLTGANVTLSGTYDAQGSTITASGNWTNSGTFTAGTSTVNFNGTGQAITGNTSFHHLTKSVASADTLTFAAASTTTVGGTCTLNGASGNLLSLRSSAPGTQWVFTLSSGAVKAISFVDVQDSDASSSAAALRPIAPGSSIDSLNNISWFLNSPDIGIDNDFSDWCEGGGNEVCIDDEGGADDWTNPAKLDITRFAVASNTTDTFYILFGFDDTNLPNPSTACVLIDTPTPTLDDKIDKTLCVTVSNSGVDSVDLFNCDDSISGGCGNATPAATSATSGWSNSTSGPWNTDTFVEVALPFADMGFSGGEVILTSMISYASNSFLKSPKDSIFGPDQNYDDRVIYDIGSGGGGTVEGPGTPVIAGNVYIDEGSVSIGSGKTVNLFVNGSSVGTNTTDAGGGYFFSTSVSVGQTLLAYIDNDGSYKGTSASVSDGANLTDLDIYAAHLITRHDNGGALTNANLSTAKGGSGDTDILYSVSGSDLTVTGTGTELYLPSSHNFSPAGAVTTDHLKSLGTFGGGSAAIDINGTLTIADGTFTATSATTSISGNFDLSGGSFAHNAGTVTLDGTSQSISGSPTFKHLTKTVASADTLTFTAGATTTVEGTCTLQGADSNLLSLRSSSDGTRWNLTLPAGAAKAISYVDVKDSDASGSEAGLLVINPANSTSSGNNLSWFLPLLTITKTASAGTANPGAVITYTVLVSNTGAGEATDVVLDDHLSPYTAWSLDAFGAATPFEFTDGAPSSALTLGAASYSDNDGGNYTYTPTSTGGGAPAGYDGNVTNWKIPMTGTMDSGGSFTLKYKVRVE